MDAMNEERWEVIATTAGMTQAKIIAGRLESEEIPTRFQYEAVGTIYAITVDGLGEVKILVPVPDWERAREVLSRTYDDGELREDR